MEYADFVYDFDIKHLNKKIQTVQNTGLYIAFNQHFLPYGMNDSTETLHRRANLYQLVHRRKVHMLAFMYNYITDPRLIDVRDINTRRRDGILFKVPICDHYKARLDPLWQAMDMWNKQPINLQLKLLLGAAINNPFKKVD